MYVQFPDADIRELGVFQSLLRRGDTLSDAADRVPFPALRMRLLTHATAIEAAERGWQTYNQPQLAAGDAGF